MYPCVYKAFSSVVMNIGLGIAIYEGACEGLPGKGYSAIWVYAGFVVFQIAINAVLYAYFSYSSSKLPSLQGICIKPSKTHPFACKP